MYYFSLPAILLSAPARRVALWTILLFMAISMHAVAANETPLKVFLLAGQSNMDGHGNSAELPAQLRLPQTNVLLYQKGVWTPLAPGELIGPEITFGQSMASHFGETIGLIKVAVGGTNLAVQWSPDDPHSLYATLVGTVKEAQKTRPIVIMGMIWMQGERDSRDQQMAQAYQKNLIHLIECTRRDFGIAHLPFVCGRVNPVYPYVALVRKAQCAVDLPGYRVIDCDDIAKNPDNLHYSAKGQQALGKRFAATMIALLKPVRKSKRAT